MRLRNKVLVVFGGSTLSSTIAAAVAFSDTPPGRVLVAALAIGAWWASGVAGFVWWQTRKEDVDRDDLVAWTVLGLALGPVAWLVGGLFSMGGSEVVVPRRHRNGG